MRKEREKIEEITGERKKKVKVKERKQREKRLEKRKGVKGEENRGKDRIYF